VGMERATRRRSNVNLTTCSIFKKMGKIRPQHPFQATTLTTPPLPRPLHPGRLFHRSTPWPVATSRSSPRPPSVATCIRPPFASCTCTCSSSPIAATSLYHRRVCRGLRPNSNCGCMEYLPHHHRHQLQRQHPVHRSMISLVWSPSVPVWLPTPPPTSLSPHPTAPCILPAMVWQGCLHLEERRRCYPSK